MVEQHVGKFMMTADYDAGRRRAALGNWCFYGYAPVFQTNEFGELQIILTIPDRCGIDVALAEGQGILRRWSSAVPIRYEILSEETYARSLGRTVVYLGVTDAAERMKISRQRVLQMIEAGRLPNIRVGKSYGIPETAVQHWIDLKATTDGG